MLFKKMLRDMWDYKIQLASIFLMAFLGLMMFSGINGEASGLETNINHYYEETNMADGWIYAPYINDLFLKQIYLLGATTQMERELVLEGEAELEGDPSFTLHFVENNTISKFYLLEGEPFDVNDSDGVWLDKSFADARNMTVGDNITFVYEDYEINKQIRGLGYSPEYVYNMPYYLLIQNYSEFGFAYMSHKAFPMDNIPYNVLKVKFDGSPETYSKLLDYRLNGYYDSFLQRSHNPSVSEFDNEVSQHKMMANIFPFVFIFVSMLMLLTTMKRIISNQRTNMGVLKANGFKDSTIILHYLSYGFILVLTGSILGLILGPIILPKITYPVTANRYKLPFWDAVGGVNFSIVVVIVVLMAVVISYFAIRNIVHEPPSVMMKPKVPKVSTSNFVDKLRIWKYMPFDIRWNYRDAKRNKFRAIMAILGLIGCTALLISAFGLHDGVNDSKDWELNKIIHYETRLVADKHATLDQIDEVAREVNGDEVMESGVIMDSGHARKSGSLLVLNHTDLLTPTDNNQNKIEIKDNEVSISQKMANLLGVGVGDKVNCKFKGVDEWIEVKIDKIHADPISQGLIVSTDKLDEWGVEYLPTSIITSEHVEGEYDGIKSVNSFGEVDESFDDINDTVWIMIFILISFAAVLAVVVLYNLGLQLYLEMERDIATLKVLGFKTLSLVRILFVQTFTFIVMGEILGLPLGYFILQMMWESAGEKRYVIASISPTSILLNFVLLVIIGLILNMIFAYKIKKMDMVDILKILE